MAGRPSLVRDSPWVWADGPRTSDPVEPIATGKWLVFVPNSDVDAWWETISAAVVKGELGFRAKAATACSNPDVVFSAISRTSCRVARSLGIPTGQDTASPSGEAG
ncbi:MAG: putative phosphothreonine lyase domain-containing protein [Acidimicrobiales bacterium]